MIVLQTIAVAFAMFSAVPVPQFGWNEKNMRYPGGALGIPHLHGSQIVPRQTAAQHKGFGVFTFAAGSAAPHQRQHWGVYGAMPPSAKE